MKLFLEFENNLIPVIKSSIAYLNKDSDWQYADAEEETQIWEHKIYLTMRHTKGEELDWYVLTEEFNTKEEMEERWKELREMDV